MPARSNQSLRPLPSEEEIYAAVRTLMADGKYGRWRGVSASELAYELRVEPARRLGSGAAKGSWSGTMSASVRLSPRLRAMARRGLLDEEYFSEPDYRCYYRTPRGLLTA